MGVTSYPKELPLINGTKRLPSAQVISFDKKYKKFEKQQPATLEILLNVEGPGKPKKYN
jgi:hypothetical protein